jgi:peptidoglycan/xylan/chitin deacetylase (PgdA/CDA1 family)
MDLKQSEEFRVPILTYHSIDNSGSVISTSPLKFQEQMQYLAESSFSVISLEEIVTRICENRPFLPKSIAITFDDGFKNVWSLALPILKEYKFKATVFLVTGHCGKDNRWNRQYEGIPLIELLEWDEISDMSSHGIDFGVHTMTHPILTELSSDKIAEEIIKSKLMIQNRLGKDSLFFAYPYGKLNSLVKGIVGDEFYGACSTDLGFATQKSDRYALPRIDMYYFSRNNLFSSIELPLFQIYLKFRKMLRSFRRFI